MPSTLSRIQNERQLKTSYGYNLAWQPLMGVLWQYGAWWDAPDTPDQNLCLRQMALYAIDYVTAMGWDIDKVWEECEVQGVDMFVDRILGRLAKAHLAGHRDDCKKWISFLLHELALNMGTTKAFLDLLDE